MTATAGVALNREQARAVEMARATARRPGVVAVLSGPAGTGKTTTLRQIARELGDIVLVAPTGRAARRAQTAAGVAASTIHRWLYAPIEDEDGQIRFERLPTSGEPSVRRPASGLVVVDESSMVNREIWTDVHQTAHALGCGVLLVGDGFQLPPVQSPLEEPFSVFAPDFAADFHVELVEVHRQALDSPILRVATRLRSSTWEEARRITWNELPRIQCDVDAAAAAARGTDTIVIAHRNATRLDLNRRVRRRLGIDPFGDPVAGEPLLVRKNSRETGLFNGDIEPYTGPDSRPRKVRLLEVVRTKLGGVTCAIAPACVVGDTPDPDRWTTLDVKQRLGVELVRAQLGYVVTCHAAQGSEWDAAIVVLERSVHAMPEEERVRWLYTAVTRAKTTVYVARAPAGELQRDAAA